MNEASTSRLLSTCRNGTSGEQNEALMELVHRNAHEAVPVIVDLFSSPDAAVRSNAAYAVGQLGASCRELAGSALLRLLQDGDASVRSDAIEALSGLQYEPAIGPIAALLQSDPEPLVRAEAAETLGDLGTDESLGALETALQRDPHDDVRGYAANAIGLLGSNAHLAILVEQCARERSLRVQAELLGARHRLGEPGALALLLDLLDTADEHLATVILNILEDLRTRKPPPGMGLDEELIRRALVAAGGRFPILQPHVEQLLERVTPANPGDEM
ncbi:HEAT repeat domain-containing protein [Haliangium ochraceum]|uniref:HEAT domain containing protein n=1 Tax=Haliangium ochraceum (strain DSM 14365 / JCM 11303 / SMP-2) TaxID=502025 RepID=D0LNA5_HALO1|nr:HEAT repeat domain-containing protein [Haliangium ochraceum]ACY15282.1 HEAT domain containing protein [Haliangium ochraceum DSM 14365]